MINPETIEQVSRALCIADGNDPDQKCMRFMPPHLSGMASRALQVPHDSIIQLGWELYANLARAAIESIRKSQSIGDPLGRLAAKSTTPGHPAEVRWIPSRTHDQDEPGSFVADSNDFERLAADILNEPFNQSETDRILTRAKSESKGHASEVLRACRNNPPFDFLALNKEFSE